MTTRRAPNWSGNPPAVRAHSFPFYFWLHSWKDFRKHLRKMNRYFLTTDVFQGWTDDAYDCCVKFNAINSHLSDTKQILVRPKLQLTTRLNQLLCVLWRISTHLHGVQDMRLDETSSKINTGAWHASEERGKSWTVSCHFSNCDLSKENSLGFLELILHSSTFTERTNAWWVSVVQ